MAPSSSHNRKERSSAGGGRRRPAAAVDAIAVVTPSANQTAAASNDNDAAVMMASTISRAAIRQKSSNDVPSPDAAAAATRTPSPRRVLFGGSPTRRYSSSKPYGNGNSAAAEDVASAGRKAVAVTPSPPLEKTLPKKRKVTPNDDDDNQDDTLRTGDSCDSALTQPSAKRRLLFGRYVNLLECAPNVEAVYKIVRKLTGNIGGNGYSGPIYGELTMHSMQKMINLMVNTTGLSKDSRFIDVGSGIGKPNLHVAQYPGVAFSCGVEMEHTRWALGMTCLKACLDEAVAQRQQQKVGVAPLFSSSLIQGKTTFLHKNITEAKTFDPFTHVYMFSIGFPPELWLQLSEQWNQSDPTACKYLICYHGPKDIIDEYEFEVELLAQTPTSMHGSKEGHMGYIYRRSGSSSMKRITSPPRNDSVRVACDPVFRSSFQLVKDGLKPLQQEVSRQMEDLMGGTGRTTRSRQLQRLTRY